MRGYSGSNNPPEPDMKLLIALLQILMLAAGFAANRADAMAGAAAFSVLCVVVVVFKDMEARRQPSRRISSRTF